MEEDLYPDIVDSCRFTLSKDIKYDKVSLKSITSLGFKIVDLEPVVIECSQFPARITFSKLADALRKNINIHQTDDGERTYSSIDTANTRDVASDECYLNQKTIEDKLELCFPNHKNELGKNPKIEIELKNEDHSSLESKTLAAMLKTQLSDPEKQKKINQLKPAHNFFVGSSGVKVQVYQADITQLNIDCIVNTSNPLLKHEIGVSNAIAKAAGPALVQECNQFTKDGNAIAVTEIFVSGAGSLGVKKVIHTVGPSWEDYTDSKKQDCADDLRRTVLRCLVQAAAMGMASIALPSISSTTYKVPPEICATSYLKAVISFDLIAKKLNLLSPKDIHFVDINDRMVTTVADCFLKYWDKEQSAPLFDKDLAFAIEHLRKTTVERGLNKDYQIGKVKLTVSTRHAMDLNTDLVITFGEPHDKLRGELRLDLKKSKVNPEIKKNKIGIFECKDNSSCFVCQIGNTCVKEEKLTAAFKNLNSAISCTRNLVQTLVVTSKFLYQETRRVLSEKKPDSRLVIMFSQHIHDYVKNVEMKSSLKHVIITSCTEVFPLIIEVIDSLQEISNPKASEATATCDLHGANGASAAISPALHCTEEQKTSHQASVVTGYHGNQPDGEMIVTYRPELPVPGTLDTGIYLIEYIIPNGVQNISHPAPGEPYVGCQFQAFIPATEEGSNLLKLLRVAFLRRLTFTIDKHHNTSWNGIYLLLHNINQYIVPNYFMKVTAELKAKGVTMDNLTQEELDDWERIRQQLINNKVAHN